MDRSTLVRWLVIAGVMLAVMKFWPMLSGHNNSAPQPIADEKYIDAPGFVGDPIDAPPPGQTEQNHPAEGSICKIQGTRFNAELSSRGASLQHFYLTDPKYKGTEAGDMSTTPDLERWRSLRTMFRGAGADSQLKYDRFIWQMEQVSDSSCKFTYTDADVKIEKVISGDTKPFELSVDTTVTNLASDTRSHQFSIEAFAYRKNKEIKGHLGRVSPFLTELSCARGKEVERKSKDDSDFKKHGWWTLPDTDRYAAVSNYYFAQAIAPLPDGSGATPNCRLLAEDWFSEGQTRDDDEAGAVYHAELSYPAKELAPTQAVTYKQIAYFGPKDRDLLAHAAADRGLGDLINLGFFSPVAKYLVGFMVFIHNNVVANWGVSIILMTITLRVALFPLTYKSLKSSIGMRKLKPEIDIINAKYKDDAQQKNLAMMELWRKNGVNPFGGCLPQLVQMPVWFAMYTTLQTAVEMYHTKFLWFADLSAPDKFYVLPLLLGVFMIVQQRIVPQQGMDPMQQKMMMYMLPAVFTVMMLFLPAALGVYMLTNSLLGIGQQLAVERIAPREKTNEIVVTEKGSPGGKGGKGDKGSKPSAKAAAS
ncbi:MAG: membrane protein insertase YidC [Polyangiaceae bacterium]